MIPQVAFTKGFHQMTAYNMGLTCKALLDRCPTCKFEGLAPGKSYCCKGYGAPSLVVVGEVTPKRTQAIASINNEAPRRIYTGTYDGATFIELDADLCALTNVTHQEIVAAAVVAGMYVPPEVRREYPALFVGIPDRFAQPNISAEQRVINAFSASWVRRDKAVTPATLDAQIEEAHQRITTMQDTHCQAVVVNPDTAQDWDRYIAETRDDIDFYRWLRRLVDVGNIFHIKGNDQ